MKRKKHSGSSEKDPKLTAKNEPETSTDSTPNKGLGRRGFLKIGAGAAAVTLVNPLESIAQRRRTLRSPSISTDCSNEDFTEPKAITPQQIIDNKTVLNYELKAQKLDWKFRCPGGQTTEGWQPVFNGALPGPTLYVDPGSTINLELHNNLDEMPMFAKDKCPDGHHADPTLPACFQHTNLHFHGLQVSPCSMIYDKTTGKNKRQCGPYQIKSDDTKLVFSSDDVLVDIFPNYSNTYKVVLPDMHAPGTNWYHSHLHGGSAYQVSGGMAGAIIIREPEESQIVRQDLDKVFLLQEILVNPPPTDTQPWPDYPPIYGGITDPSNPNPTRVKTQFFINGKCRPTLQMRAGEMMRWRFINTAVTPGGLTKLKLVKTPQCSPTAPATIPEGEIMHLIAIDGLSFYGWNPQPVRYHLLALGGRADFLVKLEKGLYTLYKDGYPLDSVNKPASTTYTNATANNKQVLMYIDVQDSSDPPDKIPDKIPGKKPAYLNPIAKVDPPKTRTVKFQNPAVGKFQIDGKPYNLNPDIHVELNTAEEWTLVNNAGVVNQSNTHPFHVHLNPFQIDGITFDFEVSPADRQALGLTEMKKDDPCNWPFWDTVALPGAPRPQRGTPPPDTQIKIRSRFLIYDGEYVTHCHILLHEDVGMMINVKLDGEGKDPGERVTEYPTKAAECIRRTSGCPGDTPP
jgi:FtsP/CotA-like multicopper oxidase with cupredoxin domain